MVNTIHNENAFETVSKMDDKSINCVVTSPPYYGLRDYGHDDQIGLEETPQEYVEKLVSLFRDIRRVLTDDGTVWLNLGDSYATQHEHGTTDAKKGWKSGKLGGERQRHHARANGCGLPSKNLIGIPWRVAFALQADGWYLRQDIIWHKPNPMPESVTDRCTKSHEYIFLLTKSARYYFDQDAIKEVSITQESRPAGVVRDREYGYDSKTNNNPEAYRIAKHKPKGSFNGKHGDETFRHVSETRNKRSVWTVNTKPYKEAHFAVYPQELIIPCIQAGCPKGGVVYDPFMGSGTTAVVAHRLKRNWIGSELNAEYCDIANKRLAPFIAQKELF